MFNYLLSSALLLFAASAPEEQAKADEGSTAFEIDAAAVFKAAGFTSVDGKWSKCGDPGTPSYQPGKISKIGDFNNDGRPDAVVTEGSSFCFGRTGTGFSIVSQQENGEWWIMTDMTGIPKLLDNRGINGWPDIEVAGPGFCFPIWRWAGAEYVIDHYEYKGKPCQP